MNGFKNVIAKIMIFAGLVVVGISVIYGCVVMDNYGGDTLGAMILIMGSCLGLIVTGIGIVADHLYEMNNDGSSKTINTNDSQRKNGWICPRCSEVNVGKFCWKCRYENVGISNNIQQQNNTPLEEKLRKAKGGWICPDCNKLNASYIGTCACGASKY